MDDASTCMQSERLRMAVQRQYDDPVAGYQCQHTHTPGGEVAGQSPLS